MHLNSNALRFFFKYLDSTSRPTMSYSIRYASLSSGHAVRLFLETHKFPSKSDSCEDKGHVQLATGQGSHFVRSAEGLVPGEQRTQVFDVNGEPLVPISTIFYTFLYMLKLHVINNHAVIVIIIIIIIIVIVIIIVIAKFLCRRSRLFAYLKLRGATFLDDDKPNLRYSGLW